jgi:hypothetical protein
MFKSTLLLFFFLSFTSLATAQKREGLFTDTLDGAFDISNYLFNLHGFLPVPTIITDPAVGYGGMLAGIFFIPHKYKDTTRFQMPDMAVALGGLTANGTWFVGGGYLGFWKQDKIRYRGIFGYANINLHYYGTGDGFLSKNPIKFSLKSYFFKQQVIFRIKNSNFLLGGSYQFSKTKVVVFEDSEYINPIDLELINSGISFISEYDALNNFLSPTKGIRINLSYSQYLKAIGGNQDFGIFQFFTNYYQPILKRWVAGFRVESLVSIGDAPFYMIPFISMRGIPSMRYQGQITALIETEQQIDFTPRWGINVFGGYGQTFNYSEAIKEESEKGYKVWNAGAGFRYLIARKLGLKMGIDVARGPEVWAFYIVFGSAWIR